MNGSGLDRAIVVALSYVQVVLALIALAVLAKKRALGQYKPLTAILALTVMGIASLRSLLLLSTNRHLVYQVYYYSYWSLRTVEDVLMLLFCLEILRRMFSSWPKAQSISTRIFFLVVFLWCAFSASLFFEPHLPRRYLWINEENQLNLLMGVVSFCTAVVIFVCVRRLGFRIRSRYSGFGLGLLFVAVGAFSGHLSAEFETRHYDRIVIFASVAACVGFMSWIAALSWPEPVRETVSV
jgi:hypothetical protein